MSRRLSDRADPRRSWLPAVGVAAAGLALLLVDGGTHVRPGPLAYLLTPTPVAVLAVLRVRPTASVRRLLGLTAWGLLGTTAAGLATVLLALSTPASWPTGAAGFLLLDVAVLAWFVGALAGSFLLSSGRDGAAALAVLGFGPVAQFGGVALLLAAVAA